MTLELLEETRGAMTFRCTPVSGDSFGTLIHANLFEQKLKQYDFPSAKHGAWFSTGHTGVGTGLLASAEKIARLDLVVQEISRINTRVSNRRLPCAELRV